MSTKEKIEIPITAKSIRCETHNLIIPFVMLWDQHGIVWQCCPYCLLEFYMKHDFKKYDDYKQRMKAFFDSHANIHATIDCPDGYTTIEIGRKVEK